MDQHPVGPAMVHPSEAATKGPNWRDIFEPGVKHALVVGVGIQVLQQFSGINGVLYYTSQILEQAGVGVLLSNMGMGSASASLLISAITTLLMLPSIAVATRLMDVSGRRLDKVHIAASIMLVMLKPVRCIYLVFEYMEHDLTRLLSCPDIKFSDAQIKCYMKQLLHGIEHCHSRGVMHRDVKASNILVNNEGILKIADFGLANFLSVRNKQPLTRCVVTLWYWPSELLLGSTNYGVSVDLWSVGCVFAELFIGRPILKGRTELHKIFKLCGTPPDEYWKKSKVPLATMFKPQHPYESTLRERCKEFPKTAVNLIETFISIEPDKRGTASSALDSEYFNTKPYACDPSSLPKYPPNREIDAKFRDEARK
ncbi:unnamed protein product [Ilex paraguariensis]|uniref:Protein kinase domain-containing protein n=1 Tax=Ilex paraguariensis TaxID=185542 RepID=A0ABC8T673_9AQUA